jgi:hypothetical protein
MKSLKKISIKFLMCILILISGCDLVSLEEPASDNDQLNNDIIGPQTIPSNLEDYGRYFHNNSTKTYAAISFTLATLSGLQDCRLDDHMTIYADGRYQYDGGTLLCGAEDSEKLRSGTWVIIENGNALIFDQGTVREYRVNVDGLSESEIALTGGYLGLQIVGVYKAVQ